MSTSPGPIGIVAFSFGKRSEHLEPNPCNAVLATTTSKLWTSLRDEGHEPVVVAQWEIALALSEPVRSAAKVVYEPDDGSYLGSEEVWAVARAHLRSYGVTTVVPIAHRFLHLHKVRTMIGSDGYELRRERIGQVGFDPSPENQQWWTKGPLRLAAYAVHQALRGPTSATHGLGEG